MVRSHAMGADGSGSSKENLDKPSAERLLREGKDRGGWSLDEVERAAFFSRAEISEFAKATDSQARAQLAHEAMMARARAAANLAAKLIDVQGATHRLSQEIRRGLQVGPRPVRAQTANVASSVKPEAWTRWVSGEMTMREAFELPLEGVSQFALLAFQMFEQGRYLDARTLLEGLIAYEPRQPYFWTALGTIDFLEEDLEYAEQRLSHAIALDKRALEALANRGELYLKSGRWAEALADFKAALDLDVEHNSPRAVRVRMLCGLVAQAIQAAQRPAEPTKKR
jgi:tetratricopeptide (TPR) repeat protein